MVPASFAAELHSGQWTGTASPMAPDRAAATCPQRAIIWPRIGAACWGRAIASAWDNVSWFTYQPCKSFSISANAATGAAPLRVLALLIPDSDSGKLPHTLVCVRSCSRCCATVAASPRLIGPASATTSPSALMRWSTPSLRRISIARAWSGAIPQCASRN